TYVKQELLNKPQRWGKSLVGGVSGRGTSSSLDERAQFWHAGILDALQLDMPHALACARRAIARTVSLYSASNSSKVIRQPTPALRPRPGRVRVQAPRAARCPRRAASRL